jgi:hypothetical protein
LEDSGRARAARFSIEGFRLGLVSFKYLTNRQSVRTSQGHPIYLSHLEWRTVTHRSTPAHTFRSTSFALHLFCINCVALRAEVQQSTTATVRGTTIATYSDNLAIFNIGMLRTDAKNVPGRNIMVRATMVFIAAPSVLVS